MAAWNDRIRWGVIEDARGRHGRERRHILIAMLLVVVVAVPVGFGLAGGGAPPHGVPTAASGSVRFVSLRSPGLGLFTGPSLGGQGSLCMTAIEAGGLQASCGQSPLPRAGLPLEYATGYVPRVNAAHRASNGGVWILLAAPNVAAVRVGDLGTVRVQNIPGLPPGDHAVAFRVAAGSVGTVLPPGATQSWIRRYAHLGNTPGVIPVALDQAGHRLPFRLTGQLKRFAANPFQRGVPATGNAARGRCAVAENLPGLSLQSVSAVTKIVAIPAAGQGALLTCLWETYGFQGLRFRVAVMLNAIAPTTSPGPIWDAKPLPNHPGIVAVQHAPNTPENALVARRVGNAWLVVAPWVGYVGYPTLAQRLHVLDALHITRLDLSHA